MQPDSPFLYGEIVTKHLFIGREEQISLLEGHLISCQNTIIYGNRRVGKSSLVFEAIERYKKTKNTKKHLFLALEISRCNNVDSFIKVFCTALEQLIHETKPLHKKFKDITNFISSIRPVAKVDSITGMLEHSLDFVGSINDNAPKTLDDIFDFLEKLSKEYKITVVLDEFQSIVDWTDSDKFQWHLRSRIQKQRNIGYIFLGSSRKLISKLFMENESAFYQAAGLIYVENYLDSILLAEWIKRQFQSVKMNISGEALKKILNITRLHPYYTQKLCHHIWVSNRINRNKNLELEQINQAINSILKTEQVIYEERFNKLSKNQKSVIKALCNMEAEDGLYQARVIKRFSLPSKASIQSTITTLENEVIPLIYKEDDQYVLEDPFFELWLKQ